MGLMASSQALRTDEYLYFVSRATLVLMDWLTPCLPGTFVHFQILGAIPLP